MHVLDKTHWWVVHWDSANEATKGEPRCQLFECDNEPAVGETFAQCISSGHCALVAVFQWKMEYGLLRRLQWCRADSPLSHRDADLFGRREEALFAIRDRLSNMILNEAIIE